MPSFEEEKEDPLYLPKADQMKYLFAFSLYKDVSLFKREIDPSKSGDDSKGKKAKKSNGGIASTKLNQYFYRAKEAFPCMKTRVEVDMSKVEENSLNPISKAILFVKRRTVDLKVDTYHYRKLNNAKRINIIDSSVISLFTNNISSAVNNLYEGDTRQFIDAFLIKSEDSDKKKVDQLKEAVKEQIKAIQDALNVNVEIVPDIMKELNQHALKQIVKVMKKYKDVLD